NEISLPLVPLFQASWFVRREQRIGDSADPVTELAGDLDSNDLLAFFHDRLKVTLRDAGARHDLVDAVIAPDSDDILEITRRVEALSALLGSPDGQNLLAGYRRAANILAAEEKKDGRSFAGTVDPQLLKIAEEQNLATALEAADAAVAAKVRGKDR